MRVKLSIGDAHLRIVIDPPVAEKRRKVWITLELPDGQRLAGLSTCDPRDRFTRFAGKKLAFERLLYSTANGWKGLWRDIGPLDPHLRKLVPLALADKGDRGRLWAAVLGPKYASRRWATAKWVEIAWASDNGQPELVTVGGGF